jgi:hypothetical protein
MWINDATAVLQASFKHGEMGRVTRCLWQITHTQVTTESDLAFIVGFLTNQNV